MVCEHPIRIVNRSNHWDETKPLFLTVPCGKCFACRQRQRNDWFVRCYYQWQTNGWHSFFYTLTFNEEHLPYSCGIPVFSKRLVQLFLKRLRHYLKAYGIKLKYMITSEFGELRQRPHHHAIFFVDKFINAFIFYKLVEKAWTYGFVKYGDNFGIVNSVNGIKYVTKYITKDMAFSDKYIHRLRSAVYLRYERLFQYMCSRCEELKQLVFIARSDVYRFSMFRLYDNSPIEEGDSFYDFVQKFLHKANDVFLSRIPFHLQSTNLGSQSFMQHLSPDSLLSECVTTLSADGNIAKYTFPRYFKRLLWYDVVENENDGKKTLFRLSDAGIRHQLDRSSYLVQGTVNELKNVLANTHIVNDAVVKIINTSTHFFFNNRYELIDWMQNFDLDLDVMAIYKVYFRDRVCADLSVRLNEQTVKDSYLDYAEWCLTHFITHYDYGKIYERYMPKDKHYVAKYSALTGLLWNNHEFFQVYDSALAVLECCSISINCSLNSAQEQREKDLRKLKELFK